MKRIVWLMVVVIISSVSIGQGQSMKLNNLKEIKVGDKMPDILLGTVINNNTNKTRFSDFKGKLVILDFWASWCTTCIEGFPHMAALQKEFGDKIQVFLVNSFETEEEFRTRIMKNPYWKNKKNLFPSSLPLIIDAKELGSLFPAKNGIPYHVWINEQGIVCLRGLSYNTNKEKIGELLADKKVNFIRDGNRDFNLTIPLYAMVEKTTQPVVRFNALLTSYTDEFGISSLGGPNILNQPDSIAGTMRNALINNEVIGLYYYTVTKEMNKESESVISDLKSRILLLVKDTLHYTDNRTWYRGPTTDKTFSGCRFSYEQITPLSLSDAVRKQYMLEDLNRYFGALYGAEGKVEKLKIPCWLIVRISKQDKLLSQKGDKIRGMTEREAYDKKIGFYKNRDFKDFLQTVLYFNYHNMFLNDIVIDEAGYIGRVDILLPRGLKSIEDMNKALRPFDLEIMKAEREVKMLVIREIDY